MASTIQIKRGTGSAVPSGLADGELAINLDNGKLYFGSGSNSINSFRFTNLTADNYIVSSSVTSYTFQTLSGSSDFGDDVADIHKRTGSLNISGALNLNGPVNAITVTGNINANGNIVGDDGTNITNISTIKCDTLAADANDTTQFSLQNTQINALVNDTDVFNVTETLFTYDVPVKFSNHITASGNISASGDLILGGGISFDGDETIATIGSGDDLTINPQRELLLGSSATDVIKIGRQSGTGGAGRTEIYANTATIAAKFQDGAVTFNHPVTASGNISSSGNIVSNNLEASNNITAVSASIPGVIVGTPNLLSLGDPDGNIGAVRATINQNGTTSLQGNATLDLKGTTINIDSDAGGTAKINLLGNVTASANISASGIIKGNQYEIAEKSLAGLESDTELTLGYGMGSGKINLGRTNATPSIFTNGHITASGNISASGTVFTDTISSPTNNLIVSSSTVTITSTTDNEANLILEADTDNNDENDNPFMSFKQDGGGIAGVIGLSGDADKWPDGTTLTGVAQNAMIIGMTGSAGSNNRQLYLVAGNTASLEIKNDADVHIMNGDLKLDGTNGLYGNGHLIAKFDSEIIIGAGNRPLELNSTTTEVNGLTTFTSAITASIISASGEIKVNTLDIASTSNFADDITLGDTKKLRGVRIVISASQNNNIYGATTFNDIISGDTTLQGNLRIGGSGDTSNNWISIDCQNGNDSSGGGITFYETGTYDVDSPQYGAKIVYNEDDDEFAIGTMDNNTFKRQIYMKRNQDYVYLADAVFAEGTTPGFILSDTSTTVADGDNIGNIGWRNEDDDSYTLNIKGTATEDHASNSAGGSKLEFYVTPNTTSDLALAVTIEQDKSLTVANNISASGTISGQAGLTQHSITGTTDGEGKGDVVYFGGTTSMTAGAIYHYKSDGTWELADADDNTKSDGLLGVALGAASDTNGVLLRGMVTLDHDPGAVGDPIYLTTTAGDASSTAPSGNGNIVRIIGYCLHASNGQIWFNPDSTFVEVNA